MKPELQDELVDIAAAIKILLVGGVGIMATDTVYGLTARADNPGAVKRLYALKHRERKPGTIIAASIQQLLDLGIQKTYLDQVKQWWPNPLSIVIPTGANLFYLHQGLDSLPFRIPKDEKLRAILEQTGPLATSSANRPGEPNSEDITQAWNYFEGSVDFYVDGGDLSGRVPSTIIRLTDDGKIETLRQGAVEIS
jgi:L-threonylcarbamoyladenylate synthase